jgi:hypothetical protein
MLSCVHHRIQVVLIAQASNKGGRPQIEYMRLASWILLAQDDS